MSIPTAFDFNDFNLLTITVQLRDAATNILYQVIGTIDSLTSAQDQEPPTVTITSPADGAVIGATSVTLSADIVDASGTAVTSTPAGINSTLPGGGGSVSASVPLGVEGSNLLVVSAEDDFDNVGANSVTVTRDTTPPTVTISSPTPGSIFGANPVSLTVDIVDATATTVTFGANTFNVPDGGGQVIGSPFFTHVVSSDFERLGNKILREDTPGRVADEIRATPLPEVQQMKPQGSTPDVEGFGSFAALHLNRPKFVVILHRWSPVPD